MQAQSIDERIVKTPGIAGGSPRIAGHRIRVKDIVTWYEYLGMSADEIAAAYDLELADIFAALAYYHSHLEELQQSWREEEKLVEALKKQYPSRLPHPQNNG
ncbi:MAG: DUF433 domain-containing protein [Saprospiraceae bacterium]|nr:DUF433 domain-containing protein [Saprospiraceae bacterium]